MGLEYEALFLLASTFIELTLCYTLCQVLDMRSNKVFVAVTLLAHMLAYISLRLNVPQPVRFLLISVPSSIVFPIAWSRGSLGQRALWTMMPPVVVGVGETVGALFYFSQTGLPYFSDITAETLPLILTTYALILVVVTPCLALLISLHNRMRTVGISSSGTLFVLLLWSYTLFWIFINRWDEYGHSSSYIIAPAVAFLGCLINAFLGLAVLGASHAEAKTRQDRMDAAVHLRQTKHLRAEIEQTAERTTLLRQLRHDLANQLNVVMTLAQQQRTTEADKHLQSLMELSSRIAKNTSQHNE